MPFWLLTAGTKEGKRRIVYFSHNAGDVFEWVMVKHAYILHLLGIRMQIWTTRMQFKPFEWNLNHSNANLYSWYIRHVHSCVYLYTYNDSGLSRERKRCGICGGCQQHDCKECVHCLECKLEPFKRDSNHSIANSNHSNANSIHSNRIRTIRLQIWTTRMRIPTIQMRFETFDCKF